MAHLTYGEILEATGGRLLSGRPDGVAGLSIDSRTIGDGELFVALKGARFDGHDFVREALQRGSGAIVSVPPASPPSGKVIIHVSNTLKALQAVARYLRRKTGVTVVGVTGTNGKTTTKEMAASILSTRFRVLKNTGNLNNQIGLPLSLLGLTGEHEVAVLEMGASAPGDIRELCEIALPDYGVLTNIGHAHIEGFQDIGSVRAAKMELLDSVRAAAVNADDQFLMEGIRGFGGRLLTFGMKGEADLAATGVECAERHCVFRLEAGGRSMPVSLGVTGAFNIYNALAAAAVGALFGMDMEAVKEGLERFEGVPMRLEVKELAGAMVLSDVYNANPASMEEALKELVRLRKRRALAVLGDMLELGSYAEEAHRRLGRWMARFPIDLFVAVGPLMRTAAEEFMAAGGRAVVVQDAARAREALMESFAGDDTILIKGSRGMRMEDILEGRDDTGEKGKRTRSHAL
ncbi:MAG: UDP-N-acetylmuramoyl-tripeptide--D-alanyl-D-alanine ligase [Nitrospirota bacterium]